MVMPSFKRGYAESIFSFQERRNSVEAVVESDVQLKWRFFSPEA